MSYNAISNGTISSKLEEVFHIINEDERKHIFKKNYLRYLETLRLVRKNCPKEGKILVLVLAGVIWVSAYRNWIIMLLLLIEILLQ